MTTISDATNYNLPSDYIFERQPWGDFFYKTYGPMSYFDGKNQCESDGAYLAFPRSDAENNWLRDLFDNTKNVWIGLDDLDQEGVWITNDGLPLGYSNWYSETAMRQPDNSGGRDHAAHLHANSWNGKWADQRPEVDGIEVVCSYNIDLHNGNTPPASDGEFQKCRIVE